MLAAVAAMTLAGCTQQGQKAAGNGDAAASGGQQSDQAADAYIDKAEKAWAAMATTKDASILNGYLADDFVGVTETGDERNKQQEIKYWSEQPSDFASDTVPVMKYRHYGDTVIAQGAQTLKPKGGAFPMKIVWTDVWMYRDGKWQAVASQDSVVPAKASDDMG